ncbi:hypothetical protein BDA99DRAFT_511172 [Phascolomyces articulosus]|uniref:NAD(P)-binding domain-containing protein n=1 Tax=Phascolomyces articulosus TaxID=60185 RepID=A0AAD5K9K3_9FUNG|nr:hypothetical protein BDA99DRAFT_511172 [Phascolomyces articulosus]
MVYEERIYLVGATGNIGKPLVQKLLQDPKVALTLFTRKASKVQEIFGTDHSEGKITIVEGDYDNKRSFEDSITGHTRLFLLLHPSNDYARTAQGIAEIAYNAGVKQIVLISGIIASLPWHSSSFNLGARQLEQGILSIPNKTSFVTLRPAYFMSNIFQGDVHTIKSANKFFDSREKDQTRPWISPKDIGELAAIILQEPVEKHGDAVYEMIGDPATPVQQAEALTRVLGREIAYEKITDEQNYEMLTKQAGMPHGLAFMFTQLPVSLGQHGKTVGLSILLGRQPQTLEQWIEENKTAFL